jgi:hypothetical protein
VLPATKSIKIDPPCLRALNLVISLDSLRIRWRHVGTGARGLSWRRRRGSNEAVLLARELRIWCVAVDGSVSLLASALSGRRILWLALNVVIGHIPVSLLFIVDVLVGWVG